MNKIYRSALFCQFPHMAARHLCQAPLILKELIAGGDIVVIRFLELFYDFFLVKFKIFAEGVKCRIVVSELHIEKAGEHIGIFGQHGLLLWALRSLSGFDSILFKTE